MKKELLLDGLHCAGCAAQIEKDINKMDGVTASLNFVTKTLSMEIERAAKTETVLREAITIIKNIEPNIAARIKDAADRAAPSHQAAPLSRRQCAEGAGLVLGGIFFAAALFPGVSDRLSLTFSLISYGLIGGKIILQAVRNISRGRLFDEYFLMGIATAGAFAIGQYHEGVAVMLFYRIGALLQDMAVNRSRRSISALMDIRPDSATLLSGKNQVVMRPQDVHAGDRIIVKPGERIPLDGCVINGSAALDVSALTGEPLPREVSVGDDVLAGSINSNGILTIEVSRDFSDSTVNKILELVENASQKKTPTENFITTFARYYTPFVVAAAAGLALIPPLVFSGAAFSDWLERALVFLVVSCPCALVISIPLSFFAGIGAASRKGILVKGSNYLEALTHVNTVVFDKTGTLTQGVFSVVRVQHSHAFSRKDVLRYAAHAEWFSTHPIALSIQKACRDTVDPALLSDYEEIPGQGVRVRMKNHVVLAGNGKLMDTHHIDWSQQQRETGSLVHIAVDTVYAGSILIADTVKKGSRRAIAQLRAAGVNHIAMLSGDNRAATEAVAQEAGIFRIHADLLPQQKVDTLDQIRRSAKGGKVAFVGDGINDAPALAVSDIGIAMGGLGSDAAIEAADIVLMTDEVSKIAASIRIARKTRAVVWQNIIFALGVKIVILILGALGLANMWQAVFGDVGVTLLAVLNSLRCLKA